MSDLERAIELDRGATVAWEKAESRLDHWEEVGDRALARKAAATAASARLRLLETREKVVVAMLEERIKLRQNRSKYEHLDLRSADPAERQRNPPPRRRPVLAVE